MILEMAMITATIILFARMAMIDDESPALWGVIAAGICGVCLLIPLPLIRIGIACAVAFGVMMMIRVIRDR